MKLVPNPVLKIPELSFLALATAVNGAVSESWGLTVQVGTNVSYFRFKVKIFYILFWTVKDIIIRYHIFELFINVIF